MLATLNHSSQDPRVHWPVQAYSLHFLGQQPLPAPPMVAFMPSPNIDADMIGKAAAQAAMTCSGGIVVAGEDRKVVAATQRHKRRRPAEERGDGWSVAAHRRSAPALAVTAPSTGWHGIPSAWRLCTRRTPAPTHAPHPCTSGWLVNTAAHTLRPRTSAVARLACVSAVIAVATYALRRAPCGRPAPSALLTRTEVAQERPTGSM